jgi:integration host factor subunit beta
MTNGSMTKAELVEEVSRVSDLTKKHSEVIVDTVFKSIIDALHRGEKIELRGFGSFRLRKREPRKGRNPKTGDKVDVPPKKVPYFKPGKELKELINREPGPAATPAGVRTGAAPRSFSGHQWFTQPSSSHTFRSEGRTSRPKRSMFSIASSCGMEPICSSTMRLPTCRPLTTSSTSRSRTVAALPAMT